MILGKVIPDQLQNFSDLLAEYPSGEILKLVHNDIQAPEDDLFFVFVILSLLIAGGSNMIQNSYGEPHPQIVLSC